MPVPFFIQIVIDKIKAVHAEKVRESEELNRRLAEKRRKELEEEAKRMKRYREMGLPYHHSGYWL